MNVVHTILLFATVTPPFITRRSLAVTRRPKATPNHRLFVADASAINDVGSLIEYRGIVLRVRGGFRAAGGAGGWGRCTMGRGTAGRR